MCTWAPQEILRHPRLSAMLQSLASARIRPGECTCPFPLMKRDLVTQESGNDECEDFWFFWESQTGLNCGCGCYYSSIFFSNNPPCRKGCLKLVDFENQHVFYVRGGCSSMFAMC